MNSKREILNSNETRFKILLEIIFNKKPRNEEKCVRMSDLLNSTLSLNNSFSSRKSSEKQSPTKIELTLNSMKEQKRKKYDIKIKLVASNLDDSGANLTNHVDRVSYSENENPVTISADTGDTTTLKGLDLKTEETRLTSTVAENKILPLISQNSAHGNNKVNHAKSLIDDNPSGNPAIDEGDIHNNHDSLRPQRNAQSGAKPDKNLSFDYLTKTTLLSTKPDSQISNLIHELVLERYDKVLNDLKQRRMIRPSKKNGIFSNEDSEDVCMYYTVENSKTFQDENWTYLMDEDNSKKTAYKDSTDSGLDDSEEVLDREVESRSTVEYDEHGFLSAALGAELMNVSDVSLSSRKKEYQQQYYSTPMPQAPQSYGTEKSIGSSDISTLISCSEQRSSEIYSLYSTVNKSNKKNRRDVKNSLTSKTFFYSNPTTIMTNDYESLENFVINSKEEGLIRENAVQREIIYQISKALTICRNQRRRIDRDIHVEAEKILLFANFKKNLINEELNKVEYEEPIEHHASITVMIKNLKFTKPTVLPEKCIRRHNWYFVCVLHSDLTVFATKIVCPSQDEVFFEDSFQFEGHSRDFEIDVSLFALVLKNSLKKRSKTFVNLRYGPDSHCSPTQSFFTLWGKTQIRPSQIINRTQNTFTLTKIPPETPILNTFTADVETSVKLHVNQKGFLTVGTDFKGCPIWNRRWCVLDGSRLKYWNHPNEEHMKEPMGHLDLLNALTQRVGYVDKEFCPRPRTLSLDIKVQGPGPALKEYFLSADTLPDFEEWRKKLNLVLEYLRQWKNVGCYLEN